MASQLQDRRVAPRLQIALRIGFSFQGGQGAFYSADISMSGIFLETANPFPVGNLVQLEFTLGGAKKAPVKVQARVVRQVSAAEAIERGALQGMGLRFERFLLGKVELEEELGKRLTPLQPAKPVPPEEMGKPRVQTGVPAVWGTQPGERIEGQILNLSATGAFLATEQRHPPGTILYLSFELPLDGKPVTIQGIARVVRLNQPNREPSGMGIGLDPATQDHPALQRFVGVQLQFKETKEDPPPPPEHQIQDPPPAEGEDEMFEEPQLIVPEAESSWMEAKRALREAPGVVPRAAKVTKKEREEFLGLVYKALDPAAPKVKTLVEAQDHAEEAPRSTLELLTSSISWQRVVLTIALIVILCAVALRVLLS